MKLDFLKTVPYVCERWAEVVAKDPSAVFLTEEESGTGYTRRQADEQSGRVYAWLKKNGIGAEDFVLIRLPRDARPFIAMLGVWKAGAAFTVVEDSYAPERIDAIRQDCGCRLVLDSAAWEEILHTEPLAGYREADDHDACFAIYTSGSTGKPKGVLQEYGKIKLNQASLEKKPGDLIDENNCMAQAAPLNFIAAVKIFLNALYSGMHLVVFSTETARNPVRLNEQFNRYQVNLAFLTPSILRVMSGGLATSLRTLVTGSEAANGLWFEGLRLINNYGMSEAGFHVAQFEIDRRYDLTPIGKPLLEDICIRLLDEKGQEVPDGQEGEICFDNPFFRGYVHLPEETKKVLRDGVFHSGDMGRRLPDGNITVTGRLNTMVKINGNRVEPGEIEAAMRRIPGIRNAAVRDFQGDRQQVFLCAYYVADEDPGEDRIRACLRETLPHYMIPAFFTRMDSIPLNSNGKADRFALPKPDVNAKTRPYEAPGTPEEKRICEAYEKVLEADRVGLRDDFFELGGDSLSTAVLAAELSDLGVDYRDIYACRTPGELAVCVSEKSVVDLDAMEEQARKRDQHPTPYQVYFYDAQLYAPKQTMENNYGGLRFRREAVDPIRLKAALETVFRHYSVFSTVFVHDESGELMLRYVPGRIAPVDIVEVEEYTDELIDSFIRPFMLENELMYRCTIYTTGDHVILAFDTHHTISDGTMMANFMSEVFAAYRGEPLKKDHYYTYLETQHRQRAALEAQADARLLMEKFNRADDLCSPLPDLVSRKTGNGRFPAETTRTLGEYMEGCKALRTSLNKLFVAAGLIALSRCGNTARAAVEWTYNGRDENWKQDLMGITLSSVPVSADMSEWGTAEQLFREIDRQSELGMRYADLSLGNNGVTPGDRDRLKIVYESGFDFSSVLPEGTEMITAYDRLNGTFTRMQVILLDTWPAADKPIPFYINYNSEVYTEALAALFAESFKEALDRLILGGTL